MFNFIKKLIIIVVSLLIILLCTADNYCDYNPLHNQLKQYISKQKLFHGYPSIQIQTIKNNPFLILAEASQKHLENPDDYFSKNYAKNSSYKQIFKSIIKSSKVAIGDNNLSNKGYFIGLKNFFSNEIEQHYINDIVLYSFQNQPNSNDLRTAFINGIFGINKLYGISSSLSLIKINPYVFATEIGSNFIQFVFGEVRDRLDYLTNQIDSLKKMFQQDRYIRILGEVKGNSDYLKLIIKNYFNITNALERRAINANIENISRENLKILAKLEYYIEASILNMRNAGGGDRDRFKITRDSLEEISKFVKISILNTANTCYSALLRLNSDWSRERLNDDLQRLNQDYRKLVQITFNKIIQSVELVKASYKPSFRIFSSASGYKTKIENLKLQFINNINPYINNMNYKLNHYLNYFSFLKENDNLFTYYYVKFNDSEDIIRISPIRKKIL